MITPIIFNPIENNPYFWWNGLEIPIQLKYLFEKVLSHDETIKKLVEAVNKFNEEFEQEIKQEVVDTINAMYESGELAQIIGEAVSQSLISKCGVIDLEHIGRVIRLGHNFQNASIGAYDTTYDKEYFNYAQGNCVFEQNGTRYWAVAYVCNNGTHFKYSNNVMLVVYKFDFENKLRYVTHQSYGAIGHANGVGYCNGYIYISPNSEAVDDGNNQFHMILSRKIFRIKFNDNETLIVNPDVVEVTDIPAVVGTGENIMANYVDGICGYNNELYFFDGFGDVYKFDWDTRTSTLMYECPLGNNEAPGGLQIDDNFVYLSKFGSNQIMRYNKRLGVIDWTYQLPEKSNCGMYATGEIEGFSVLPDGMLYCLGCYDLQRKGDCYTISRFFRQSLVNNAQQPSLVYGWSSAYTTYHQTFVVYGDYPSLTDDPKNITGLTNDSAFTSVPEALEYINHNDWIKGATIIVKQKQNTMPISIETIKPIVIDGQSAESPALLGMIYAHNCPYLRIINVGIRNLLPADFATNFMTKNCFYIDGGNVTIINAYMPTGLQSNAVTVQNGIYLINGFCNLKQVSGRSVVVPADWETVRKNVGVSNPRYISHHQCSVNTHGLYNSGGNIIN